MSLGCLHLLPLNLWLLLGRIVYVILLAKLLSRRVDDPRLVSFHLFPLACYLNIPILLPRLHRHRPLPRRNAVDLRFGVLFLRPFLVLLDVLQIVCNSFGLRDRSLAGDKVDEVILVHDWTVAFGAGLGSGLTGGEVGGKSGDGDVEVAILTKLGLLLTSFLVLFVVSLREVPTAVGTLLPPVKLLLVLLLEVDVEHLAAHCALLYVAPTVPEVRGHLRFRKILKTVVASLHCLVLHLEIF